MKRPLRSEGAAKGRKKGRGIGEFENYDRGIIEKETRKRKSNSLLLSRRDREGKKATGYVVKNPSYHAKRKGLATHNASD